MDFLKVILGEELYSQVEEKINAHNGNEENKDNQIKIGNLGKGEYVSKSKYDALGETIKGKDTEIATANELIAQLKKGTKGNEELQGKITDYEKQVVDLQEQLKDTKLKSAIKVALLSENAVDVDYLTFKLNEKLKENNESLELDENDNIKGWEDRLGSLKTQFPTMFKSSEDAKNMKIEERKLANRDSDDNIYSKSELLKKSYNERNELFKSNPEAFRKAMEI